MKRVLLLFLCVSLVQGVFAKDYFSKTYTKTSEHVIVTSTPLGYIHFEYNCKQDLREKTGKMGYIRLKIDVLETGYSHKDGKTANIYDHDYDQTINAIETILKEIETIPTVSTYFTFFNDIPNTDFKLLVQYLTDDNKWSCYVSLDGEMVEITCGQLKTIINAIQDAKKFKEEIDKGNQSTN